MPAKDHNSERINQLRVAIAGCLNPILGDDWTAEEFTVAFLQLSAASVMSMNGASEDKFRWGLRRFTDFCEFYAGDLYVDINLLNGGDMSGAVN